MLQCTPHRSASNCDPSNRSLSCQTKTHCFDY